MLWEYWSPLAEDLHLGGLEVTVFLGSEGAPVGKVGSFMMKTEGSLAMSNTSSSWLLSGGSERHGVQVFA